MQYPEENGIELGYSELFNEVSVDICRKLGVDYNWEEAENAYEYLKHVNQLPKDAKEVY